MANVPTSILGYDPRQAYQAYVSAVNARPSTRDQANEALPFDAWFTAQAKNSGTYGIANLMQEQYANATGKEMTSAQQQQMYRVINSLPPTTQQALLAAGGTDYLAGGSTNVSRILGQIQPLQNFIYGASGGAAGSQATPTLTPAQQAQLSAENNARSTYLSIFGRMPDDGTVKRMAGMNASDMQNFMNTQPYKMGLNYGQWTVSQGNINKLYMQYFGRNADDNEVVWANGKSVDDITAHIMDSPSRVDGLNMGKYLHYKDALDQEATKQFGYAAPDEMIKAFHTSQMQQ